MNFFFKNISLILMAACFVAPSTEGRDRKGDERVKYVQADVPTSGDGSKHHPFKTLADAETDEANWDVLIVRSSTIPLKPEAPFHLSGGKKLIGEENPLEVPSLTQPTIAPNFLGEVIVVSDEVTIENIYIRNAQTAINYSNATNLTLQNILITTSNVGLLGTGLKSGKTHLNRVTIANSGTAIDDMLTIAGVSRQLIVFRSKITNVRSIHATTEPNTSSLIKFKNCNIAFSTLFASNQGEQTFLAEETSCVSFTITFTNAVDGLQSIDLIDVTVADSGITLSNKGSQSVHVKQTFFNNANANLTTEVGGSSPIELIECMSQNGAFTLSNKGAQSVHAKQTVFNDTTVTLTTDVGGSSPIELIECTFANASFNSSNTGKQIFCVKESLFSTSRFNCINTTGKQSFSFRGSSFADSVINSTNAVAASSSLDIIACNFSNTFITLSNGGEQSFSIKKSSLANGDGIFSQNKGHSKLTVDDCLFESIFDVVKFTDTNSSTDLVLKNSVITLASTVVGSIIFDQTGTSSREKISLINNTVDANILYSAINNSLATQSGQTEVLIEDTTFNGFTVVDIGAFKPWSLLNINLLESCFKGSKGIALNASQGLAGNATIHAHKNSFANFDLDIQDVSSAIKYYVSKNWWGHDPAVDCTGNVDCGLYQTCLKGVCQGPIVNSPFKGTFVTPLDPLTQSVKCPHKSCK